MTNSDGKMLVMMKHYKIENEISEEINRNPEDREELIKSFGKYPTILTMQFVIRTGTCYFKLHLWQKLNTKTNLKNKSLIGKR
jgi:hypothetical protein